jgi:uncharacterized membrane protein
MLVNNHGSLPIESSAMDQGEPVIRRIGFSDPRDTLSKGLDDFNAYPTHAVFLAIVYPFVGLILGGLVFRFNLLPLPYPVVAGFALLGPLAAIGLYEVSRTREQGQEVTWRGAFGVLRSSSIGAILALDVVLMVIFVAWLGAATAIYTQTFGDMVPTSVTDFAQQIFSTPAGQTLFITGNAVGFVFALVAFAISVVSFPMLVDRPVGATTAAVTSIRAVLEDPVPMVFRRRRPCPRLAALPAWLDRRHAHPGSRRLASVPEGCGALIRALNSAYK